MGMRVAVLLMLCAMATVAVAPAQVRILATPATPAALSMLRWPGMRVLPVLRARALPCCAHPYGRLLRCS